MSLEPYKHKWEAFGWHVIEIDGHNMKEIVDTLRKTPPVDKMPTLIISNTIKGKGLSFMEKDKNWHGGGAIKDYSEQALKEVERFSKSKGIVK